jgi:sRNA-binding protein
MRSLAICVLGLLGAFLGGCNSEGQQKIDMQACSGYGFKQGTPEYANCMMQTAQNRAAQQAANQRQQSYNDTIAQQAQRDRDAQERAQRDAQNAAHQAEIEKMMNSTSVPNVTAPTIPSIDTSNMHCTGQQGANAGSMSCTSN